MDQSRIAPLQRFWSLASLLFTVALVSCASFRDIPIDDGAFSSTASLTPGLTSGAAEPVATWTPVPSEELAELRNVVYPKSTSVVQGKTYDFTIYSHCVLDFQVDFDGSLWQVKSINAPFVNIDDPLQDGRMTLVNEMHARFEFDGGSILYVRHQGPQNLPACE